MLAPTPGSGFQELQRSFAEAIFSLDAPVPAPIAAMCGRAPYSRFCVYRNNVVASLIGAIGARYPACRKLLWPESFDAAARLYVMSEPPRSPVLLQYGNSFPQFLRKLGNGAATEYVADIAKLETARVRAYHAADAEPVSADAFGSIPAHAVPDLQIRLHPSVTLLRSRFPFVSAWDAAMQDGDAGRIVWRPETALISRPDDDVEVRILPPGGFAFLAAIEDGCTVGEAAELAARQGVVFDLAACFATMLRARIAIGVGRRESESRQMSRRTEKERHFRPSRP
jgi:hypothetical protein